MNYVTGLIIPALFIVGAVAVVIYRYRVRGPGSLPRGKRLVVLALALCVLIASIILFLISASESS